MENSEWFSYYINEMNKTSKTIGLLIDSLFDAYQVNLATGIHDKALAEGYNFLCFKLEAPGLSSFAQGTEKLIKNALNKKNLDGLIVSYGTIQNKILPDELPALRKKLPIIPIVGVSSSFPEDYNIRQDKGAGMKELLDHLLGYHKLTKIAYVGGPKGNIDADVRFEAYKQALEQYNIPYREDWVHYGDFWYTGGKKGAIAFFKEKKIQCEAVVCANDYTAVSFIKEAKYHGVKIPEDCFITGFDDIEEGRSLLSPLTTVKMPAYTMGVKSVEVLKQLLNGEAPLLETIVPTRLIIRGSCGCTLHNSFHQITNLPKQGQKMDSAQLTEELTIIIEEHIERLIPQNILHKWAISLTEFVMNKSVFQLESVILEAREFGIPSQMWLSIILKLFELVLIHSEQGEEEKKLSVLFYDSKDLIQTHISRDLESQRIENKKQLDLINRTNRDIFHILEPEKFLPILENFFDYFFITFCHIGLYTSPEKDRYKYLLRLKDGRAFIENENPEIFPIEIFIEKVLENTTTPLGLLTFPLCYKDEEFGFIIFKMKDMDYASYDILTTILGNTLKTVNLVDQVQNYSKKLESMVEERTYQLEKTQNDLIKAAHQAGMSEISSGVLHNVGNILNTINTNMEGLHILSNQSKINQVIQGFRMMKENETRITEFFSENEKGKQLLQYFIRLIPALEKEQAIFQENTEVVMNKIQLMKSTIHSKQDYVKKSLTTEKLGLIQIINSSLAVMKESFQEQRIQVIKRFQEDQEYYFQSNASGLIQIFINLFKNAAEAMKHNSNSKIIALEIQQNDETLQVRIRDNGKGIKEEHLDKVFNYGFSTKKTGHGFGLNTSSKFMKKMGGSLEVESEGPGMGACFIINLKNNL